MQFQTLIFAVFFVLVLSANWLLRRHDMPRKLLLVLASYYFYFHLSFTWLMPSIV